MDESEKQEYRVGPASLEATVRKTCRDPDSFEPRLGPTDVVRGIEAKVDLQRV